MYDVRQSDNGLPDGFWDAYIQSLLNQGIKVTIARWYVIRAEQFLKAHPDKTLTQIQPYEIRS